jgi:hypothetical protein
MAANPQVIVLTESSNGINTTYSGVFWFPITSGVRPVSSGSAWMASGSSAGATQTQINAINAGTILEVPWSFTFPTGFSVASIQAFVQQAWVNANAQLNGVGPNLYYGYNWNGTSWANS